MSIKARIIKIFFENEYPKDIQDKFHQWLIDSSYSEEKDQSLKSVWDLMDEEADSSTLRSLEEVKGKLNIRKSTLPVKRSFISRFARVAAILFLPILSCCLTYIYLKNNEGKEQIQLTECFASNGELKTIILPDSTTVTINSGSIIIYPEVQIGNERSVYLIGEAYFQVKHNPDIPFKVKTDGVEVEVLGTRFNVSAYSDDPNITTTLEEGTVKLNFSNAELSSLTLAPNDEVIYNKITNQVTNSKISGRYIAAWKEGHLLFRSASIHDVLRSFENRYGVTVYLNSNNYEDDMLTVKFVHGETLDESLQILKKIIPEFRYKLEKDRLYIY